MVFSSVGECIAYIENAIADCMPSIATEMKKYMDEVTRNQVRGWSGQIFKSVTTKNDGISAEAEFSDDAGKWYSLITEESVGNPIKFLEAGTTWNRGASNIMSTSLEIIESRIPIYFVGLMRGKGIPIE